jgi:threonine/homoserine/homoserine lactone efflux protein
VFRKMRMGAAWMGDSLGWAASAVGLGFAYAALPGAVNAEALRRGAAGGFRRSLLVHGGALLGAGFWAVIALTGTSFLARYEGISIALGFIGAAFLLRLTLIAVRGLLREEIPDGEPPRSGADLTVGIVVGIANPAGLPFWTGLASDVMLRDDTGSLELHRAAVFVAGVLMGSLIWGLTLSSLIAWGRRYLNAGFFRAVNALCAIAFGYFAVRMLWTALSELLD